MKNIVRAVFFIVLAHLLQCQATITNDTCGGCRILTPLLKQGHTSEARARSKVPSHKFLDLQSHAGFLTVKEQYNSNLFFWFFPASTPLETTPWIIWLQGGPGYSSMYGLFRLVGPLKIEKGELKFRIANLAHKYSVLFIDNPVGAGYSFTSHEDGYTDNEDDIGEQMLEFLKQFLQMFPELRSAPLFLAGESYAGKYVPALGIQIHRHNIKTSRDNTTKEDRINLRGLITGGAMINPGMMMKYSVLTSALGLLDERQVAELRDLEQSAVHFLEHGRMVDAANKFNETIEFIKKSTAVSVYNFNEDPSPVNKAPEFEEFINRENIRQYIGAGNVTFNLNNQKVYEKMLPDIMNSTQVFVEELLEHYPILCYHGQQDIIMAYSLAKNTYDSLKWSKQAEYHNADRTILRDSTNSTIGYVRSGGGFTEVLIRRAGHMVAKDVPEVAVYIHYNFIDEHK